MNTVIRGLVLFSCLIAPVMARDPFAQPDFTSCRELAQTELAAISRWQFVGLLQTESYQQLWLSDQQQQLTFHSQQVPPLLAPWQLQKVAANQLYWQLQLPSPCEQQLDYTMLLTGAKYE